MSLDDDTIQDLARAMIATMAPATGARATGTMTVSAPAGGGDLVLPRNAYMMPVIDGSMRREMLFKVGPDPTTQALNGSGGDWAIPDGTTVGTIAMLSNIGGVRHNLPAGTTLRFDPPLTGFDPDSPPFVDFDMTGGDDVDQLIRRVDYYEDITPAELAADFFKAGLTVFPAVAVLWQNSGPVEGRTAGASQGSTRLRRRVRWFRETFTVIIAVGANDADKNRRHLGLVTMQAITQLLTDMRCNPDGEILSYVGSGVEINNRSRFERTANLYTYSIQLRCSVAIAPIDSRTFSAWLQTNLQQALPGREAPEPTDPLVVVDVDEPMT